MTDYELVNAFLLHAELMITYFMGFISATSALLVVAHIAGPAMPVALARVAIAIYSLTAIFLVAAFHRISAVIVAIRGEMGPSLGWHPVLAEPAWVLSLLTGLGLVAMLIVACAAVWYFRHVRAAGASVTVAASRGGAA